MDQRILPWIPAFAGMSGEFGLDSRLRGNERNML